MNNEKIFNFEIINNLPALYNKKDDLIVISDLHLGLEGSMTYKGSYVPEFQLDEIKRDIKKCKVETNASRIIINGDLKTEFRGSMYSEKKEIEELYDLLEELFKEVIVIKGNHDTFIEGLTDDRDIKLKEKYYLENEILYTHGHIDLETLDIQKEFKTILIGHEHPAIVMRDDIGIKEKLDCFLYGKTHQNKEIIVLPAFSKISNGTNINETPQSKLLSPILRKNTNKGKLKAIGILRGEKTYAFPELRKI